MSDAEREIDRLAEAVDRLTVAGGSPGPAGDAEIDDLLQVAARLRGLPDPAFKRWLKETLLASVPQARALGPAARIGLIADTRGRAADGSDLPQQVLEAFAGVDLIVHCGDIGHLAVLDRLATVAPVLALRGEGDPPTADPRVAAAPQMVEAGGVRLGVVFDIATLGGPGTGESLEMPPVERVQSALGGPVDAVAFGASHREMVACREGLLLVNPGSPTLPDVSREGEVGTVALLEMRNGTVTVEIVRLRK